MRKRNALFVLMVLILSATLWADSTDVVVDNSATAEVTEPIKEKSSDTASVVKEVTSTTTKVVEEELSLEEELELIDADLLVSEEIKKDTLATDSDSTLATADSTTLDTTEVKRSGPNSGSTSFTSTSGRKKVTQDSTATEDSTIADEDEFSLTDVEIDDAGAVDLDKNMKEYRSPRRAMLYSLAVPGWGQAYTKRTWKSVLFGVLEVGFVSAAIKMKKDAEDKVADAHAMADANYSMERLQSKYQTTLTKYSSDNSGSFDDKTGSAEYNLIQIMSNRHYTTMNGFVADMADPDFFYDRENGVGSNTATLGWVDNALLEGVVVVAPDNKPLISSIDLGSSALQLQYIDMLNRGDELDGYKQGLIVGVFANHVASAIDAFITARRHNRRLLAMKDKTAYRERIIDKVNIDNNFAFDVKRGVVTKVGFVWNF